MKIQKRYLYFFGLLLTATSQLSVGGGTGSGKAVDKFGTGILTQEATTKLPPISHVKDILKAGEQLTSEQSIFSPDGIFELKMQGDGNLVLYQNSKIYGGPFLLWSSKTDKRPGATVIMQDDGNLVIYLSKSPLWASKTEGNPGSHLKVQNDGNVVIYRESTAIWATGTRLYDARPPR